jgi:hypothetical protein
MAKKILKEGQTKFKTTCEECGTLFSYELEDVRGRGCNRTVSCPSCGASCIHVGAAPFVPLPRPLPRDPYPQPCDPYTPWPRRRPWATWEVTGRDIVRHRSGLAMS